MQIIFTTSSLLKVHAINRDDHEQRVVLVLRASASVRLRVPQTPADGLHSLVAALAQHHVTDELVPLEVHHLHPLLDHVGDLAREQRAPLRLVLHVRQLVLQQRQDGALHLLGVEVAPVVRRDSVRVLEVLGRLQGAAESRQFLEGQDRLDGLGETFEGRSATEDVGRFQLVQTVSGFLGGRTREERNPPRLVG